MNNRELLAELGWEPELLDEFDRVAESVGHVEVEPSGQAQGVVGTIAGSSLDIRADPVASASIFYQASCRAK